MAGDSHTAVILGLAPGSGQLIMWWGSGRAHGSQPMIFAEQIMATIQIIRRSAP